MYADLRARDVETMLIRLLDNSTRARAREGDYAQLNIKRKLWHRATRQAGVCLISIFAYLMWTQAPYALVLMTTDFEPKNEIAVTPKRIDIITSTPNEYCFFGAPDIVKFANFKWGGKFYGS